MSRRAAVLLALALCTLAPVPPGEAAGDAALRSGAFEPARPAPELALPATTGGEFRLSGQRGKVIALTFGYTSCPDICPTVLAELAQVRARLGAAARRVQVAYVTVDPDRDSSARLRAYTEQFDKTFVGLTGTPEQLAAVWKAYGVSVVRRDLPGTRPPMYLPHHSASVFLVDPAGRLRVMAPFGTPVDDVVHDIRILLEE